MLLLQLMRVKQAHKSDFPAVKDFIALKEEGNLPTPAETAVTIINILTNKDLTSGERYHVQDFR